MTLSSLSAFSISLAFAALSLVLGPGESEAKVKCGSILGPGGTYMLTKDLVCPAPLGKDALGALYVKGGATLDLNGHTVTCSNRGLGIRVNGATLTNGTVRGCATAVVVGNGIVRRMTLIDNFGGVAMSGERSTGNNLIEGNIATGGNIGFSAEEADNNTFIDNQAIGNGFAGFYLGDSRGHVLRGNLARGNGIGFRVATEASSLTGNRALGNVNAGFYIWGGIPLVENKATGNGGPGFQIEDFGGFHMGINHNVAKANGGDGFSISLVECASCYWVVMTGNSAIGNAGIGLHLLADNAGRIAFTQIRWNTATGNAGADLADDTDCASTSWTENTFGTAQQACIH
jgi:parallel beta-helix repeat protein